MGTVFRKAWTSPLPPGAEVVSVRGCPTARWRLRNGTLRTAEVLTDARGRVRIRGRTATFVAKYRDGSGVWTEVPTGCKDETAAKAILANLERRAELIRAGVITAEEDGTSRHGTKPIEEHLEAWKEHLRTKGTCDHWLTQAPRRVRRICEERGIKRLRDLTVPAVERWLRDQADAGLSAGTRNGYRRALVAFANWCVRSGRLASNPLTHVATADDRADRRRTRRALTDDELVRLLDAARRRPLAEALTIQKGKRRGQQGAKVSDAVRARLERVGRERALIYKTLVLTGLRKGELASITVTQADLGGPVPWYWTRRRDLFDRFDDGICHDEEGLYSIKPMVLAQQIAALLPGQTVVDGFGGLGGVAVALAQAGKRVDSIEIVRTRAAMLRANVMLYGLSDRVSVHEGDAFDMVPHMRADALYLDPPWGGPAILRRQRVGFDLFPRALPDFLRTTRRHFRSVAISLPPNFDRSVLVGELQPDRVVKGSLWRRDVVITAFFGLTR